MPDFVLLFAIYKPVFLDVLSSLGIDDRYIHGQVESAKAILLKCVALVLSLGSNGKRLPRSVLCSGQALEKRAREQHRLPLLSFFLLLLYSDNIHSLRVY